MKLHLGCGQRYLDGYLNIDFPISEHSLQKQSVADIHADICALSFPTESVDEIRLHHVFEHFTRPVACALLTTWFFWLNKGGTLHIEVPDLSRTALVLMSPFSNLRQMAVAERHLFGSHEASWGGHQEGYSEPLLKAMVEQFGYKCLKSQKSSWQGTYNVQIWAQKSTVDISVSEFTLRAETFLSNFLVDSSPSEKNLLSIWMNAFISQLKRG